MNYCNDFKYDLKVGRVAEKSLSDILSKKKVEVKLDRWAQVTGNIAVEFENRGKPSGILKTRADYWCFVIEIKGSQDLMIMIDTERLKSMTKHHYEIGRIKRMGDNNMSTSVLIPLKELVETLNKVH